MSEVVNETGVTITVNGQEVSCRPGELLIDAAQRSGTYIPRFCYHERMKPVGMCRMCLVDVDTGRGPGLQPSCMVSVADGMVVDTESERTVRAQEGILELLLVNHPLDCPVCDKGGECPLQDQTMAFGPGESRFVEEKRHYEKPIPISDLVYLDRERCILCDRCTRFAKDVAGDPLIHFIDRGNATQVNTFPNDPFSSYFSGNVVQICPVGALTAKPYRFAARPWDLTEVESTSTIDSTGARIIVQSSRDHILRMVGLDSDAVNWGWLSDKERFAYEAFASEDRLGEPLRRDGDQLVSARWSDALAAAGTAIAGKRVGVLGGARLPLEGQYAWSLVLREAAEVFHADAQLGDGLPTEVVMGLPRTTISEAFAPGSVVVTVGVDAKEDVPTLFLRLRHAVTNDGVSLIELGGSATSLSPLASARLHGRPGTLSELAEALVSEESVDSALNLDESELAVARELLASDRRVTVVYGRGNLAESTDFTVEALASLQRASTNTRFLPALRRGNVHGALEVGLGVGGQLAGAPVDAGLDGRSILEAAVEGSIDTLVLLGADPISDALDGELAERALRSDVTVIAVDLFPTDSVQLADLVLPASAPGETEGSFLNLEGRLSPLAAKVTPPGQARPDWMIAVEVGAEAGVDVEFETLAECREDLSRRVPAFGNVAWASLDAQDDGELLDLGRTWELEFRPSRQAVSGEGLRLSVGRKLWDRGTLVSQAPSLAGLIDHAHVSISPVDADRLDLSSGTPVRVESPAGGADLELHVDAAVPPGSAAIPFHLHGVDVRELFDGAVTEVEVRRR